MKAGDKAKRLRIYISYTDKHEHSPLYEVIVYAAREKGIAGATVLRGIMGYGSSSEVYTSKLWEITEKVPLVVDIVDDPVKISALLEALEPIFKKSGKGHIVTEEETTILLHRTGIKK